MIKEIGISSTKRNEFIDITDKVESLVKDINEGIITVSCPHTTAAVTINENADPDVQRDILWKLSDLIPKSDNYHHSEGNSDAHIKSSLIGQSVAVIVMEGKLILGTWQAIFFCEFDGPRERKVVVKA